MWSVSYSEISAITSVDAVDETAYVSGLFRGAAVDLFAGGTALSSDLIFIAAYYEMLQVTCNLF